MTAIVLDYYRSRSTMLPQVDGFLLMARDFYKKAMELKAEQGANNRRLATVAAVHSLEMFLYGFFERRPELGVSSYREKGDETLGARAALSEFQESLRRNGVLPDKREMSHRNQVIALVRHRDSIIHHAVEISEEELTRGLRADSRFVGEYGLEVAEIDLLQ